MTGHDMIPAEVVSADDARAVSIAVATNLLRRQDLTIIERGKGQEQTSELLARIARSSSPVK